VTLRRLLSLHGQAAASAVAPAAAPLATERQRLRDVVAAVLGLQLDSLGDRVVGEALASRARGLGKSIDSYLAALEAGPSPAEMAALAQELTVGETYFFRNLEQFDVLRDWIATRRAAGTGVIRVLSAGCASGEEPYSIAMLLREAVPEGDRTWTIRAVDANPAAIEKARRARYTSWALREMPAAPLRRWLRLEGVESALDDAIRDSVTFEQRNLCADDADLWAPAAYDVIFCRNVLIHLTRPAAEALATRLARSLAPGGALFLGHAETMRGLAEGFVTREAHGTFWYEHAAPAPAREAGEDTARAATTVVAADPGWAMPAPAGSPIAANAQRDAEPAPSDALAAAFELLRQERFDDALAIVRGLPKAAADTPRALLVQAVLLAHRGDYAGASRIGMRLLAIDESDADAYHMIALCREGQADRRGAMYCEWRAVALDPGFALARMHLGLLARRVGDRNEMRRQYARAEALLAGEADSRIALFGGGFGRHALLAMCRAELLACGEAA